jgi:hypothetical protein
MKDLSMKIITTLLCALTVAGCTQITDNPQTTRETVVDEVVKQAEGRVLQYGIYTLLRGGKIIDSATSSTGKAVTKPVITRDRETDRIPLIKDKYMAYQYRLSNIPGRIVKLRRVLQHPAFHLPDGTTSTGSDFTINKKLERGEVFAYDAYAFNEDYEMVEGEWVFQIWYKGNKLVEQRFTTYHPDTEKTDKKVMLQTDASHS